jgi:putrescine transport system permease protein
VSTNRLAIVTPFAWLLFFFLVPFAIVGLISLSHTIIGQPPYAPVFGFENGRPSFLGSVKNYLFLFSDQLYVKALLSSLRIASVTTILCLFIAYPMAYVIARADEKVRTFLLIAVVLPFWTSFLIRVYAWMGLLRDNGLINQALLSLGVVSEPIRMLNTDFAVYLGIVYAYLPFMILPLYSTLERLDWRLLDAAADLGCRPFEAFLRITLPLSLPGILAGMLLVFIPVTGEFVIPALLGGPDTLMIGKVLWEEFFNNHDWPIAAALAVLIVALLVPAMILLQRAQAASEGDGRR